MNSGKRVLSTTAGALLLLITFLGVVSTFFAFSLHGLDMDLKRLLGYMSFSNKANYIVDLIIVVMLFANHKKFLYIPYIAKTIFPFLNGYIHFEISDFHLWITNIIFIIMLLKIKKPEKNNRLCKGLLISQIILMYIATLAAFVEVMSSIVYPVSFLWVLISGITWIAIYLLLGCWIGIIEISPKCTNNEATDPFGYVGLVMHTVFLLFTFGIWDLIWIYRTTLTLNNITNKKDRAPLSQLLLCMFVPFYNIYWTYESAQMVDVYYNEKGQTSNIRIPCLILSFFVKLVPPIIMQDKINNIIKKNKSIGFNEKITFCRSCGTQLFEESIFCNKCGAKVVATIINYVVCIFDTVTHTLRKEKKNIDVIKFPPSKFADNDTYYAIETIRDGKKVRIYYTKDNWDKQIEAEISEDKI